MLSAYNIILWNIKAQTKKFQVKLLFHKKLKWGITDDVGFSKLLLAMYCSFRNTHNTINKIINMLLAPAYD